MQNPFSSAENSCGQFWMFTFEIYFPVRKTAVIRICLNCKERKVILLYTSIVFRPEHSTSLLIFPTFCALQKRLWLYGTYTDNSNYNCILIPEGLIRLPSHVLITAIGLLFVWIVKSSFCTAFFDSRTRAATLHFDLISGSFNLSIIPFGSFSDAILLKCPFMVTVIECSLDTAWPQKVSRHLHFCRTMKLSI